MMTTTWFVVTLLFVALSIVRENSRSWRRWVTAAIWLVCPFVSTIYIGVTYAFCSNSFDNHPAIQGLFDGAGRLLDTSDAVVLSSGFLLLGPVIWLISEGFGERRWLKAGSLLVCTPVTFMMFYLIFLGIGATWTAFSLYLPRARLVLINSLIGMFFGAVAVFVGLIFFGMFLKKTSRLPSR
jgi:hypothetical protein